MNKHKTICYTLDLEHDYAGLSPSDEYEAFLHHGILERLSDLVRRFELKLTVFATGQVLEQKREIVDFFRGLGSEIELHGYHHIMYQPDLVLEVQKGVEAYRKYFNKKPMGYRSPGGHHSPVLLKALMREGIQYDSSLMPSFRWGLYNNFRSPIKPFNDPESSILEIPMGVVPKIRAPIAASYIRLVGLSTYKMLFAIFGTITPLVFLFHLVDLVPTQMRKQLSWFWRYIYAKGQKKSFTLFEKSVEYFKNLGYKPEYMSQLYKKYTQPPEWQPKKKASN
jgi:hypothetical protein